MSDRNLRNYSDGLYDPRMIAFCQRCEKDDCIGLCADYVDEYLRLQGRARKKPRRKPKLYTAFGRAQSLNDWAAESGYSVSGLRHRITKMGYDMERALTEARWSHRDGKKLNKGRDK